MVRISNILKLRSKAEQSVASLPALVLAAEKTADNIMHGMHSQKKIGAGEKFWQFRDYQQTDRPQDIDWRQSAKGDNIYIKQKELQILQRNYIWCASGKSMDFRSNRHNYTKQETAHIMALSLALMLRRSEEQVGIFGDIKTGNSECILHKIGASLIGAQDTEKLLPDTNDFEMPQHSSLIVIGDFLSSIEDIEENFAAIKLRANNALIIQILDPVEIDLPYRGRVNFRGMSAGDQEIIDNVSSVRAQYNVRIQEHIEDIEKICAARGFTYTLYNTSDDIAASLKKIWLELSNKDTHK